jgi:hypothetical protein
VFGYHNSDHYPEDNSVPYSSQFDGNERVSDLTLAELTKARHTIIEIHIVGWIDFNLAFIIHLHANPLHIVDILIEAHDNPLPG